MECFRDIPLEKKANIQKLLTGVWCVEPPEPTTAASLTWYEAEAYLRHYDDLVQNQELIDGVHLSLAGIQDPIDEVIKFVQFVKTQWNESLEEVAAKIRTNSPQFQLILEPTATAIHKALIFAIRLWLFVAPELSGAFSAPLLQSGQTQAPLLLHQAVSRSLLPRRRPNLAALSEDFSAKSLIRKGGFEFETTGDLSQHLTFDPHCKWRIRVFGCARALETVRLADYRIVYIDDFAAEVQRTLQLLFPTAGKKSIKRTRQYAKKYQADLEARIIKMDKRSLETYPVFGERLEQIQKRYDASTQRLPRQWWYDRRRRVEWATLVVAIVVFILTVVFGVISSVTGILQVRAAYKWHD